MRRRRSGPRASTAMTTSTAALMRQPWSSSVDPLEPTIAAAAAASGVQFVCLIIVRRRLLPQGKVMERVSHCQETMGLHLPG